MAKKQPTVETTRTRTEMTHTVVDCPGKFQAGFVVNRDMDTGRVWFKIWCQVRSKGHAKARKLEEAIRKVHDPATDHGTGSNRDWTWWGVGWTDAHQALIDLAVQLSQPKAKKAA